MKLLNRGARDPSPFRSRHHRCSQRMFAAPFKTRSESQQIGIGPGRHNAHRQKFRFALCESPGLINHKRIHLAEHLQRFSFLHQDTRRRPTTGPNHDRHRRRQSQRAGTGDNQNRHSVDQRIGQLRLWTPDRPGHCCDKSGSHNQRDKICRGHIGETLDRRPAPLRLTDHLHDLSKHRVSPDSFSDHHNPTCAVDGPPGHPYPNCFFDRDRFPRDHRFIHSSRTFFDHPVDRHSLSRPHA